MQSNVQQLEGGQWRIWRFVFKIDNPVIPYAGPSNAQCGFNNNIAVEVASLQGAQHGGIHYTASRMIALMKRKRKKSQKKYPSRAWLGHWYIDSPLIQRATLHLITVDIRGLRQTSWRVQKIIHRNVVLKLAKFMHIFNENPCHGQAEIFQCSQVCTSHYRGTCSSSTFNAYMSYHTASWPTP